MVVGFIVVLGLVASVLLVLTSNIQYVRIGLVSALWAAVVGAFAMTRYRRELSVEDAKMRDLQTVYQLQLEREVAARREYELGVESRIRRDLQVDIDELASLRAELSALRKNLELLLDGNIPVERPALRADSMRMQELPDGYTYRSEAYPPQPAFNGATAASPAFAGPFDEPVTAEWNAERSRWPEPMVEEPEPWNSELGRWPDGAVNDWAEPEKWAEPEPWVDPTPAAPALPPPPVSRPDAAAWTPESQDWSTEPQPWTASQDWSVAPLPQPQEQWSADQAQWPPESQPQFEPQQKWAVEQAQQWAVNEPEPQSSWAITPPPAAEAQPEPDDGSHTQGLSVAQIMANLRNESNNHAVSQHSHHRD